MIDADVQSFALSIGAAEPDGDSQLGLLFRKMFKRHNYFLLNGRFLIIKISRSQKPFWGVGKTFIDLLNGLDDYSLVLLTSANEGWVFSKSEVNDRISSGHWAHREADDNYKINSPLPEGNWFSIPTWFASLARRATS